MTEHHHAWLGFDVSGYCADCGCPRLWWDRGFAVEIAKIIFFVAIIPFVILAVFALIRGRSPSVP